VQQRVGVGNVVIIDLETALLQRTKNLRIEIDNDNPLA
jgi:hypothetical protein